VAGAALTRSAPAEVIEALRRARTPGPAAIAFDADGTLWSGDVGEDVFHRAVERGLVRDEAGPALVSLAERHAIDRDGSPSELAARLLESHVRGGLPDLAAYELMTWGYAGRTEDELAELARATFAERDLEGRRRRALLPILGWARDEAIRTVVVSASPRAVVVEAVRPWGFAPEDVAAARPALRRGVIAPALAEPLPYGPVKVAAGRALLGGAAWLAAFGDSPFDLDMLRAARVAVAVHPRPGLAAALRGTGALELLD